MSVLNIHDGDTKRRAQIITAVWRKRLCSSIFCSLIKALIWMYLLHYCMTLIHFRNLQHVWIDKLRSQLAKGGFSVDTVSELKVFTSQKILFGFKIECLYWCIYIFHRPPHFFSSLLSYPMPNHFVVLQFFKKENKKDISCISMRANTAVTSTAVNHYWVFQRSSYSSCSFSSPCSSAGLFGGAVMRPCPKGMDDTHWP